MVIGNVKSVIQRLRFPFEVMLVCVRWYVALSWCPPCREEFRPSSGCSAHTGRRGSR